MTTHIEQLAAQIRQLSPFERQHLQTLIPPFGKIDVPLPNTATSSFKGQNILLAAYKSLPDEEKLKFLDAAERENSKWVHEKFNALHAAWMMVVDGEVAAFGESMDSYPNSEEFLRLCQKLGKYPFVFFNPLILTIEEPANAWHPTVLAANDFYPTIPVTISGITGSNSLEADFDTGAWEIYADYSVLASAQVVTIYPHDPRRSSTHLSNSYQFVAKRLSIALTDSLGAVRRLDKNVLCVLNWVNSPFVQINPQRSVLLGRGVLLDLRPKVELDFDGCMTKVTY